MCSSWPEPRPGTVQYTSAGGAAPVTWHTSCSLSRRWAASLRVTVTVSSRPPLEMTWTLTSSLLAPALNTHTSRLLLTRPSRNPSRGSNYSQSGHKHKWCPELSWFLCANDPKY